jgi:hypothetical protein
MEGGVRTDQDVTPVFWFHHRHLVVGEQSRSRPDRLPAGYADRKINLGGSG